MKRLVPFLVVVAALAAPSAALASGVVLRVERSAHLIAVTRTSGRVALVHTMSASRLRVGDRVVLTTRTLRNGTLAAARVRIIGRVHRVSFHGLLLARSRTALKISAGGAVVTVNLSRSTASARDSEPRAGEEVDVDAEIGEAGELDADHVTIVSAAAPGGSLEGDLLAIATGSVTVGSEHLVLVINVPAGFDLSTFKVGEEVLASFLQLPNGTLLLTRLSGDENAAQANEVNVNQGDDGDGGDGGGDGGGDH